MAEVAPAAPPKPAKKKAAKPVKSGPAVSELILDAVATSNEKKGVSLAALKKALAAGGYDVEKKNVYIKTGIKSLVAKGALVQTKGSGASGSFKLAKSTDAKAKKPAPY
uniref:Histone H1 n=1 Tax=Gouania willdenowi TaxID=441366 RepID=A0A8C5EFS4_GOUWI